MKKILIIGPYVTNIGGVSVHILRLTNLLKDDYIFDFIDEGRKRNMGIYNIRSLNPFPYLKKIIQADIVHIHSGVEVLRLFHIFICLLFFKRTIVTVHRDINIEPHKALTRFFLHKCSKVILVNKKSYDYIKEGSKLNRSLLLPAFLPPVLDEEQELPQKVKQFITTCKTLKGKLLASNASYLAINNNQDLYGLDLCIDAILKLESFCIKFPIFLIFVIADAKKNTTLLKKYKELINQKKLNDRILIWEEGLSFINLIQESDIILRTTNTDGDALSIREGLFFGKPVIASDVVSRPEGTIIFKTRDIDSLTNAISATLTSKVINSKAYSTQDYKKIYHDIYNS